MKLIDKSAVVAEIKRRMDENRRKQALPQYFGMIEEDLNILSFIDTLEVKEANSNDAFIEKACEWLKENFLFDEAGYCKTNIYSTESMIYNFKNILGGKL